MLEEDIFDKDDVPEKKQVKYSGKQSARDEVEFDYANGFEDEFDEYDDEELDEKLDDDLDDDDDFDDDDFDDDDFDSELGDTPLTVPDPEAAKKAEQERKLKALGELFEES